MITRSANFDLPRRQSLSAQTAAAIRKAMQANTWREFLPSERRLCEVFQVSRPTIRSALQSLAKEGLIEIHQGRRNRLLTTPRRVAAPPSRRVVLVTHQPISRVTLTAYQGISEMTAHLATHGFTTEVLVCAARSARVQRRKLETFLRENSVFCCILLSLGKELQEWFATRSIPALVLGSCHPSVQLPSLDVDYRAVCRHAAGVFRAKGHRRMAFIVPDSQVAGDLVSEEGFREGASTSRKDDRMTAQIIRHDGTPANLAAKLDALFASATRPTALLVAKPQHIFHVVFYLLRRGIKVPPDVSLIARDYDHLLEDAISHYRFTGETFAHRLSRLMLQMVNEGSLPRTPSLMFPRFVATDSVARLGA